jgi:hypothetical protein
MFHRISTSAVPDLCAKFPEHLSYFITCNLRSDKSDTLEMALTSQAIVSEYVCDALVVVEHYQYRGVTAIFAPHVHIIAVVDLDTAEVISSRLSACNDLTDMDVRPVWSTQGLLRYLTMDDTALHFLQTAVPLRRSDPFPF